MKISKYHGTKAPFLYIDDPTRGMGNIWYQDRKWSGKISVAAVPCCFAACPAGVFGLNGTIDILYDAMQPRSSYFENWIIFK